MLEDIKVKVFVPLDEGEDTSALQVKDPLCKLSQTMPGFVEVERVMRSIFSVKAFKGAVCRGHHWKPEDCRLLIERTITEGGEEEEEEEKQQCRALRQATMVPLFGKRKKGWTRTTYQWLCNEDEPLSQHQAALANNRVFLELKVDGEWPTNRLNMGSAWKPATQKQSGLPKEEEPRLQSGSPPLMNGGLQSGLHSSATHSYYPPLEGGTVPSVQMQMEEEEEEHIQAALALSREVANQDSEKEEHFEAIMLSMGYQIKKIPDDGNCLFGAVADQVYGDSGRHVELRRMCMDYMEKKRDHFSQFVDEDFVDYVMQKRCLGICGNDPEIQALSELLGRPIEIYSYSTEPLHIFLGEAQQSGLQPIRISYHRDIHYNSLQTLKPSETTLTTETSAQGPPPSSNSLWQLPQQQPSSESQHVCFLCELACTDYEELQIHMLTACEKMHLL